MQRIAPALLSALFLTSTVALYGPVNVQATGTIVDYNGDGFADLAIGVPNEGVNGMAEAGIVNVIYGSASGISATATPDQRFFQDYSVGGDPASNIADVSEPQDHFGESLVSADFNGDGYTDLAVGVPDEDVGPHVDAGAVNVIYGSPTGLSSTFVPDQIWHQDSPNVEGFPDTSEHFGTALAAGDFNNDGYADLAIGTPLDYVDSIGGAGSVNVIYGSASGLSATAIPDQIWHQNSPNVEDTVEFGDHFASALATGDFNGDGYDDLAIGVPDEDINGQIDAGSVNIIYGSASGLSATAVPDQRFFQDSPDVADFSEAGDNFGASLATGDLNGDGFADLIIGVPGENGSEGGVAVIYGSASGLSATAVVADQFWTQDSPDVGDGGAADGAEPGESFGTAVASGDFNNDGYDDMAASAPGDNAGAASATPGVVNIIFGSASGLSATAIPDDVIIGNNRLGGVYALASGDFDGDGFADLAMGQPLYDASEVFFEIHSIGAVTALYGSGSGLDNEQVWTQDTPNVDDFAEDDERFGAAVSTG
jgi:hypothetical protein